MAKKFITDGAPPDEWDLAVGLFLKGDGSLLAAKIRGRPAGWQRIAFTDEQRAWFADLVEGKIKVKRGRERPRSLNYVDRAMVQAIYRTSLFSGRSAGKKKILWLAEQFGKPKGTILDAVTKRKKRAEK